MGVASGGMHSYNTRFYHAAYGTAAPSSLAALAANYTEIGEVISANGIAIEASVTKLTHLFSPSKAHEKIPGFTDAGQLSLRFNYKRALLNTLANLVPNDNAAAPGWGRYQFCWKFPDAGVWYATGFVKGIPVEVPEDDRVTIEGTFEISGAPTLLLLA